MNSGYKRVSNTIFGDVSTPGFGVSTKTYTASFPSDLPGRVRLANPSPEVVTLAKGVASAGTAVSLLG